MPSNQSGLRINRTYAVAAHDVLMAAVSFVLALLLRRGVDLFLHESEGFLVEGLVIFTAVCALVFWRTRIYRGYWRYTSLGDMLKVGWAATLSILIFLPILFAFTRLEAFPRSALVINWFVLIALLAGPRVFWRMVMEGSLTGFFHRGNGDRRVPVLLVGAGDDAELFIRSTTSRAASDYRVVGLIDDDRKKIGRHIHGVRVFGPARELEEIVDKLKRRGMQPQRLVLTSEAFDPDWVRALLSSAEGLALPLSRLPRLTDFRSGSDDPIEVRPIAIEDLLGRPQTAPDRAAMAALIKNRRVCVTGAGGTIGAELCRQIADHGPAHLTCIDSSEYNLYAIDGELAESHPELARDVILGDVRDRSRLDTAFVETRPELVFHAAALKHVHMVEANPNEGVLTNVLGTQNVADACVEHGVAVMVLVSTDKAVNPTSVMGATKRIAESYCQALGSSLARSSEAHTRLVTVRFGNVLGSSGSVVPLFQRQIASGGPVTVTDSEVTRYFMTTREAVQLVLQASALGARGAGGEIFVLDMGQPIKIKDLAHQMVRLAGFRPDVDIKIAFTGLRPGEKLFEELFHAGEPPTQTEMPGILRAPSRPAELAALKRQIAQLTAAAQARKTPETLALIGTIVPEYAVHSGPLTMEHRAAR